MLAKLKPDMVINSIYELDFAVLKGRGIKAIIADLDNTLVPWGILDADEALLGWAAQVKEQGFSLAIVSNNTTSRVKRISDSMGVIPAVPRALKPRRWGFRKIAARFALSADEVAVVGDQLFTDILGGNRAGMFTILVNPLNKKEFLGTKVTRLMERFFLRRKPQ